MILNKFWRKCSAFCRLRGGVNMLDQRQRIALSMLLIMGLLFTLSPERGSADQPTLEIGGGGSSDGSSKVGVSILGTGVNIECVAAGKPNFVRADCWWTLCGAPYRWDFKQLRYDIYRVTQICTRTEYAFGHIYSQNVYTRSFQKNVRNGCCK